MVAKQEKQAKTKAHKSPELPAKRGKGRPRSFDRDEALAKAMRMFWTRGYEPTSIADLCEDMGINAPSLYAAFGCKEKLFIEALDLYRKTVWADKYAALGREPDVRKAFHTFFQEAAHLFTLQDYPHGCLVILAGVNIDSTATGVIKALNDLRALKRQRFADRIRQAVADKQLPADTDPVLLGDSLNCLLEGMALHARDKVGHALMSKIGEHVLGMLPTRK